jgi:non-ribosomal peptide synthase protein (TIGR01720 family)
LLSALAIVLCRRWSRASVLVTVEGHGREDVLDGVDLSRTVGWLATTYPVRLTPDARGEHAATIRAIQHHLRQIPANGLGYGVLRHLPADPAAPGSQLPATDAPSTIFNYLGQLDASFAGHQLFHIASESSGRRRSARALRDSAFVINAIVYDGTLRVDWEYSRALHDRAEALSLLADYLAELRALISHCDDVLGGAS